MVAIFPSRKTYMGKQEPVSLNVSYVCDGFFSVFGLKPIAGRGFLPGEERKGAAPVGVLSESFWKEELGGSNAALGRSVVLNGQSVTVVGVVPDMVPSFFRKAQVWVPLEAAPPFDQHGTNYLEATGLLKPGVSMQQAQSDLAVIQSHIDKQFPENRHGVELQTLAETLFGLAYRYSMDDRWGRASCTVPIQREPSHSTRRWAFTLTSRMWRYLGTQARLTSSTTPPNSSSGASLTIRYALPRILAFGSGHFGG
jgi:MacB-like periplasmic core domain